MRFATTTLAVLALLPPGNAYAKPALSRADETAAFLAAGFHKTAGQWRSCDDPGTPSYSPGALEPAGDLNGDGLPEALVTEGGTFCYGNTGTAFSLVSKQPGGGWKLMVAETGIASFLATKGVGRRPDIEVGGPGFCFPVLRWNGKRYALNRREYDGKPCKF